MANQNVNSALLASQSSRNNERNINTANGLNDAVAGSAGLLAVGAIGMLAIGENSLSNTALPLLTAAGIAAAGFIVSRITKDKAESLMSSVRETLTTSDSNANDMVRYIRENILTDENMEMVRMSPEGGAYVVYDKAADSTQVLDYADYQVWKREKAQEYKNAGKELRIAEIKDPLVHQLPISQQDQVALLKALPSNGVRIDILGADESGRVTHSKDEPSRVLFRMTQDGFEHVATVQGSSLTLETSREDEHAPNSQGIR